MSYVFDEYKTRKLQPSQYDNLSLYNNYLIEIYNCNHRPNRTIGSCTGICKNIRKIKTNSFARLALRRILVQPLELKRIKNAHQ